MYIYIYIYVYIYIYIYIYNVYIKGIQDMSYKLCTDIRNNNEMFKTNSAFIYTELVSLMLLFKCVQPTVSLPLYSQNLALRKTKINRNINNVINYATCDFLFTKEGDANLRILVLFSQELIFLFDF